MFELDSKLAADSFWVCDLDLSSLLLMNDANFLWLILVPKKEKLVELIDLNFSEQIQLLKEINQISEILKQEFAVDKINIASLGNVVSQLHFHVIGRMKTDLAFPKPVWNQLPAKKYEASQSSILIEKIRLSLKNLSNIQPNKAMNSQSSPDEAVGKLSESRFNDSDILRKKIFFRANHRGCKETDFLLGKFFSQKIDELKDEDLGLCDQFLKEDDMLLYDWMLGKKDSPEKYTTLIKKIQSFHKFYSPCPELNPGLPSNK